jgi:hypothetical protein
LGHSRNVGRGIQARAAAQSSPSAPAPAALTLGYVEPFQKAAYVYQQTGKFRTDRIKRMMHALAGGNDGFRQKTRVMTA